MKAFFTMPRRILRGNPTTTGNLTIMRWMLILRPVIVTATLGIPVLLLGQFDLVPAGMSNTRPVMVIVFGTYLLTVLYWAAHRLSGVHRPLLAVEIAFDIFITTVIIHYTGGMESAFVGLYLLSIMCASLFFRRLVTFAYVGEAAVFYVAYLLYNLTMLGPYADLRLIPANVIYEVSLQGFLYLVVMVGVGLISSSFSERIVKKDSALISALRLLREARLDTSDILQNMTNGLIAVNMQGYIVYINHAAETILELGRNNAQGMQYRVLFGARLDPLTRFIDSELEAPSGAPENEIGLRSCSGVPIPLGLTAVPLYDVDRSRRGIIINFKDLTEKKQLLEMVRQADRMAAIGQLSAAIAHEIRNPLGSICNAAELMKEAFEDRDPSMIRLLEIIEKESERLERISNEFLNFARTNKPAAGWVNLKETVDEILELLNNDPRRHEGIAIENRVPRRERIRFDVDHLKQLLLNIFINSFEVLGEGGIITLVLDKDTDHGEGFVRLLVSDTGPGFPSEQLGNVFEPFFSTKKGGTGLGLAIVRKLVVANGGRVLARNREVGGAEIALDLPCIELTPSE